MRSLSEKTPAGFFLAGVEGRTMEMKTVLMTERPGRWQAEVSDAAARFGDRRPLSAYLYVSRTNMM